MKMRESPPSAAKFDSARVAKLMEGIGRCLCIYQRIETYLKLLLPHIVPVVPQVTEQPVLHWRSLLDSKATLGALVQQFRDRMNSGNPEGFAKYLEELVNQRNDLIHHFFVQPVGQVKTDADLEKAIDHIRGLMKFATPFERALREITSQFAVAIEQSILDEQPLSQNRQSTGSGTDAR